MNFPVIGAALGGLRSLLGTGLGIAQLIRGSRMKPKRPTYQISQEAKDQLGLAQNQLNAGLAGKSEILDQINSNQSGFINNIKQGSTDSSTLLATAGLGAVNKNKALNNLAVTQAQDYQNRLRNLMVAQNNMTTQRDKAFQYNEYEPFIDESRTKSSLIEGGIQNILGGIGSASGLAGQAYNFQQLGGNLNVPASEKAKRRELENRYFGTFGSGGLLQYFKG